MNAALWRMAIGMTFIAIGLNGELLLKGSGIGGGIAILGFVFFAWGVSGVVSALRQEAKASERSRRELLKRTCGTRLPPLWLPTRRQR